MHARNGVCQNIRCAGLVGVVAMAVLIVTSSLAAAQAVGSASIEGRVSDETGATLPGATIVVSSPAMQLGKVEQVSGADGGYRFLDLPVGVYSVAYTLPGFQSIVREDVRLTAGFVARMDAVMKVGSIEETLTVSGQGPVVDLTTTATMTSFTKETLESTPTSRAWADVLAMAPGLRPQNIDVGGSALDNQRSGVRNYGTSGQITPQIEGINTRQGSNAAGMFYDYSAVEEAQIQAVGNSAEVALPGAAWNAIVKSGGNDFHGRYTFSGQTSTLQSSNVTPQLIELGVDPTGDEMRYYTDISGDLGGRIVRDRLWFYGALHDQRSEKSLIGFSQEPGPDGVFFTDDDVPGYDKTVVTNQTIKMTLQATQKYKMTGFFQRNEKVQPNGQSAGPFEPFPATYHYTFPARAAKAELTGTPNDKTLYTVMVGRQWYDANRYPQEGEDRPGNPRRFDRETGRSLGPQPTQLRPRSRWQSTGSVSLYPESFMGGSHNFKIGYQFFWENTGTEWHNMASGDYRLIFDRVGGVSGRPAEIEAYNNPIVATANHMDQYAAYVQDRWTLGRVTLNLGLRWERYESYVGEQTKEQGVFGGAGTFPQLDVLSWNAFAPRIGLAWDISGTGKSVFKWTYGLFNHTMADDFALNYNENARSVYRYRWQDDDGNHDYTPGEVDLDLNGPDFISVSGASNNILNPDLRQPVTHEMSASVEREIMPNFSAMVLYVYKRQSGLYRAINVLRPYEVYNIPITRQDPGPDGVVGTGDDGGTVTFYDFDPAYRGAAFVGNEFNTRPDSRSDSFQTIELTANKRMSNRWELMATYSATKNHQYSTSAGLPASPNDEFFPLDTTWDWYARLVGTIELPWGVYTSAYFQHLSGTTVQRTNVFRSIPNLGTVTLPMEDFGARRLPNQNSLNWRASKRFQLGGGKRLETTADLFNALNASTITSMAVVSGPTFGTINSILPPRIIRLGVTFSF